MGRRIWVAVAVVLALLVAAGAWAAWTFQAAEQHLQAARADLEDARVALQSLDAKAAQGSVASALEQSEQAARLTDRWVWRGAAAIPKVGDSADAARALVLAANSAILGLSGITDAVAGLDLGSLTEKGRVNLAAVATAGQAAQDHRDELEQAEAYLAEAPTAASGGWVIPPIEDAHGQLSEAIAQISGTAETLEQVGALLPDALGADGPRSYFVGVQAPNETRGTGGLLGTWAVVRADNGKITVVDDGANEDLPNVSRLPAAAGPGYRQRYRDDPTLVANMNLSPDYPVAAQLWLEAYRKKTGEELDGALSLDVSAVGALLTATGTTLSRPDGGSLPGDQFAEFVLNGIYQQFPDFADTPARQAYQTQLATQATTALLDLGEPQALLRALVAQVDQRRVALWLRDDTAQAALADSQLGHGLQPARPNSVQPVIINMGWSKLDTYLDRTFEYVVGRCPSAQGDARSHVDMTLRSDIPPGTVLPDYVVGTVPVKPNGPVNSVFLQLHLPPAAQVVDVEIDGKSSQWLPFEEADRPAAGVFLDLPPREDVQVRVTFDEPADGADGEVVVQPMYRDAQVSVRDEGC